MGHDYVLEIDCRQKFLYYFLPDSLIIFLKFVFNALCTICLDEDTKFRQLLHVIKATVLKPQFLALAREENRLEIILEGRWQDSCEVGFGLCQCALCCGTTSVSQHLAYKSGTDFAGGFVRYMVGCILISFESCAQPYLNVCQAGLMVRKNE